MVLECSGPAVPSLKGRVWKGLEGILHMDQCTDQYMRLWQAAPAVVYKPSVILPVIANLSSCTITGEYSCTR